MVAGIAVVLQAAIRGLPCAALVTAKLGMMKGVEVLEIVCIIIYVTPTLRDGVMHDETRVICVTAELLDAKVWAMRS